MAYMSQEKKSAIAPAVKAILTQYGLKGTLSVHHHSTLILTIKSGKIDFNGAQDINTYHIESHHTGKAKEVLLKLKAAMSVGNHDRSDISTDYFDVGWYITIRIGRWDVPYVVVKE